MELNVSCRFGFRPGGFEIGKAEGWRSFYTSPCEGWMRAPPPPPFLSFVLGSVSLNFVQYCEMPYVSLRWALSSKIPELSVRDGRCELF